MKEKAIGILIGAAIGDALGAPLEFLPPKPQSEWVVDMIGGGKLNWKPGEITDDTMMSLAISQMYLEKGMYHQDFLIDKWLGWAGNVSWDMGRWTKRALHKWAEYKQSMTEMFVNPPITELRNDENPVVKLWMVKGQKEAGNGGVMRCMPTAICIADQARRLSDAIKICQDTHPDPKCIHSCVVVVEALNMMLENNCTKDQVFDYIIDLLGPNPTEVAEALEEARDYPIEKCNNTGYTVDTVRCAFSAFKQAENFEDGLIAIVNRGNDADTVGTVAGSLLGAYYGFSAIPQRWLDQLQKTDEIKDIAIKLFNMRCA